MMMALTTVPIHHYLILLAVVGIILGLVYTTIRGRPVQQPWVRPLAQPYATPPPVPTTAPPAGGAAAGTPPAIPPTTGTTPTGGTDGGTAQAETKPWSAWWGVLWVLSTVMATIVLALLAPRYSWIPAILFVCAAATLKLARGYVFGPPLSKEKMTDYMTARRAFQFVASFIIVTIAVGAVVLSVGRHVLLNGLTWSVKNRIPRTEWGQLEKLVPAGIKIRNPDGQKLMKAAFVRDDDIVFEFASYADPDILGQPLVKTRWVWDKTSNTNYGTWTQDPGGPNEDRGKWVLKENPKGSKKYFGVCSDRVTEATYGPNVMPIGIRVRFTE